MICRYENQSPERQNPVLERLNRLIQAVQANRGVEPHHYGPWFEDDQMAEEEKALTLNEAATIRSAIMEEATRSSGNSMDSIQQEVACLDQARYWDIEQVSDANAEQPFGQMDGALQESELHREMDLERIVEHEFSEIAMNSSMPELAMEDQVM